MMKKLRIFVLLFILTFSFSVKAEVILEIDCNGKEIAENKSVTCEGNLLYEKEGINDIEFDYNTNLNIEFSSVSGFMVTNRGGKVSIHTNEALYDEIMNSTKIMEFTLSFNSNANEKEKLTISNIMINKSNDIKVDDISKDFTVTGLAPKLDSVCTLDSITIEKEKVKDFSKDKLEYRGINVTNEIIFIDAVRTSNKSSATGLGNVKVPKGETIERDITVTAEDGTKKVYKLFITNITPVETPSDNLDMEMPDEEMKSIDNTLKTLELYNGKKKIEFVFDSENTIFNIDLDEENIEKLTIKATLNHEKASFVKNFGPRDITIKSGYNKELIKVKSESGEERVITLNINYLDKQNNEEASPLKVLRINGLEVDLTQEKLEVRLPNNVEKTMIEAIPTNDKSMVKYEDIDLVLGDNNVPIEVTDENGQTTEYDVNVIRENDKKLLDNILVTGHHLGFKKDVKTYNLKINNDVNELNFIISPNTLEYEVQNNKNLRDGSKVIVKIIDDEGTHEYTINIEKEASAFIKAICYGVFGIGVLSLLSSVIYCVKGKKQV